MRAFPTTSLAHCSFPSSAVASAALSFTSGQAVPSLLMPASPSCPAGKGWGWGAFTAGFCCERISLFLASLHSLIRVPSDQFSARSFLFYSTLLPNFMTPPPKSSVWRCVSSTSSLEPAFARAQHIGRAYRHYPTSFSLLHNCSLPLHYRKSIAPKDFGVLSSTLQLLSDGTFEIRIFRCTNPFLTRLLHWNVEY